MFCAFKDDKALLPIHLYSEVYVVSSICGFPMYTRFYECTSNVDPDKSAHPGSVLVASCSEVT